MRHHGFLALALAGTAAATCWLLSDSDPLDASEDQYGSFREAYANQAAQEPPVHDPDGVQLNYFDAKWKRVLLDVAEQSELNLVMDKVPAGRFARRDRQRYDVESALNILNADLEQQSFRLIRQGKFLIVLHLDSARTRYARPTLQDVTAGGAGQRPPTATASPAERAANGNPFHPVARRDDGSSSRALWTQTAQQQDVRPGSATQQDYEPAPRAYEEPQERTFGETVTRLPPAAAPQPNLNDGAVIVRRVQVNHTKAADLARTIFLVFESRANLVREGLEGLPTFVVNPADSNVENPRPVFRIGISQKTNELLIEATEARLAPLGRLLAELDRPQEQSEDQTVKVVASNGIGEATANDLNAQIHRMVAMQPQQPNSQPPPTNGQPPPDDNEDEVQPGDSINIRGDVTIQALQDIGVLLIKGGEADVARVQQIIDRLEEMSLGSLPGINLHSLEHINSEAMAELLTSVYDRLAELRQRGNETRETVAFFPVVQPNAVLIIAPEIEMDSLLDLVRKLDQPRVGESELRVFDLKNAIATQVLSALETLYTGEEGRGLRTRIQAIANVRTNSIIVQGSRRDLDQVNEFIRSMDQDTPAKVHRVRVFQLHHSTAEELAEIINTVIQSVSSPPQTTGGTGGFGGGGFGGGTSQAPQELQDGTSVALEFLTSDGDTRQLVQSGILADVRVTADPRSNTLTVSAPEASMVLMAALIAELDGSPLATATIKVFTLENADAEASVELLTTLFENQNQEEQLGVQIAGAEDASSSLIPLQFSADIRTNTVIAVGSEEALSVVDAILLRLDSDDTRQRQTSVIQLQNAPAEEVALSLNEYLTQQQALQDSTEDLISNIERIRQEVLIAPDINSNSLIVSASPEYFSQITQIINQLDATPPEVVIQALIVEVNLDNTDEFGVELGFQDPLLFGRSIIADAANDLVTITQTENVPGVGQVQNQTIVSQTGTPGFNFNNTGAALGNNAGANNAGVVGTQGLSNFSLGRQNGDLGFGGFVFSAQSDAVSVLIRALAARRTVHVLSRPQIRTTHNSIARMEVGQQVPIVNGVTQTVTAITPQIVQQNVGIILEVTPRIKPDGTVALIVYAEKSAVAPGTVPVFTDLTTGNSINSVIINTAIADTTVNVPNGQTIVIGGMITKTDETLERKVPWLGDLPIVGKAFRYDGTNTTRTELLIFLTPRIIYSDIDAELIKQVETERMHFIESEAEEIHGPLYSVPPPGMQQGQPYELPPECYLPGHGPDGMTPQPETLLPPTQSESYPPPPEPETYYPETQSRNGEEFSDRPIAESPPARQSNQEASRGTTAASRPVIRTASSSTQLSVGHTQTAETPGAGAAEAEPQARPDMPRESWVKKMLSRKK